MIPKFSLNPDQLETINQNLEKSMALARMLASCAPERTPVCDPPLAKDVSLVMQVMLEELEPIREIIHGLGKNRSA